MLHVGMEVEEACILRGVNYGALRVGFGWHDRFVIDYDQGRKPGTGGRFPGRFRRLLEIYYAGFATLARIVEQIGTTFTSLFSNDVQIDLLFLHYPCHVRLSAAGTRH